MKKYNSFLKAINESAPRIPNSEEYWKKKGKIGKEVMIYFHDDLDGIYSATVMKNYLENKGFVMHGYGIVNYQEGWNTTKLDSKYINIALDYAENVDGIDVYMDHHGSFELEEIKDREKNRGSVKTDTTSAYEGICDQLGLPIDASIQNVIDMVDSAKYDDYEIDQEILLKFDPKSFKSKLEFAAAFNQMLKRSDHKTFIEVVANSKDMAPSIYNVYRLFRLLYPANNMNLYKLKSAANRANIKTDDGKPDVDAFIKSLKLYRPELLKHFEKDFIEDAKWRLKTMQERTRGTDNKNTIHSQQEFMSKFQTNRGIKLNGYQILGNMMFVPSGTWANALRARSILETDSKRISKIIDNKVNFEKMPTISYFINQNSDMYDDLKSRVGQTVELVGDLSYNNNYSYINVKEDVSNKNVEGMKGIIDMATIQNKEYLVFRAKQPIFWVLLQYGNTFQVASYHKLENYDKRYLPKLKDGTIVGNLGKYCEVLLNNFEQYFGLNKNAVDGVTTVAGGHKGIGSISNIFGRATKIKPDVRFLDLIKNKMIQDLSGIPWDDITMPWGDENEERKPKDPKDIEYNKKTMLAKDIRDAQDVYKERK
jgi:hypothetical protein